MNEFTDADRAAIRAAAAVDDPGAVLALLHERFGDRGPGVEFAAVREADELRTGLRITEADAAIRAAGVLAPARDESSVVESYSDGSYLMRDAPGGLTGDVVAG